MYLLIPKFLFKNKYLQYFYGVCCYIIVGTLTINIIKTNIQHVGGSSILSQYQHIQFIPIIFIMLVFLAASTAIKLFQQWIKDSQRINDLEKTTMHIELEQLKNQINPHFLFNMLNNASVLAQKNPQKASQLLISLSDLLRYQLYDSTRSRVLLIADIQFITDFLNLEKTRRDNFEFRVHKKGDINGIQIPPLIYTTFVENAVKHNFDSENKSYVHINFELRDNELRFTCVNSKPLKIIIKNGLGGLGLVNVKRRLELLYPHKHLLEIIDDINIFTVHLNIKL